MSDPLYHPPLQLPTNEQDISARTRSKLPFHRSRLDTSTKHHDDDDDTEEWIDEEDWVDDSTYAEQAGDVHGRHKIPLRCRRNAINNNVNNNNGTDDQNGIPNSEKRHGQHARTKDPRRSGSPTPHHDKEIFRRREDFSPIDQKPKPRYGLSTRNRTFTAENHQANKSAADKTGRKHSESSSPEDLEGEVTGFWDRLDRQEDGVAAKTREGGALTCEASEQDMELSRRPKGKRVTKRGKDTFIA